VVICRRDQPGISLADGFALWDNPVYTLPIFEGEFQVAITTAASRLGTGAFSDAAPLELRPNSSPADIEAVILAVYRHVLGNPHLLTSDRLVIPESLLRDGKISVQEFIRQVAKSDLYKNKFFYNSYQNRVIELNYKHLLGRAPYNESEIVYHLDLYQNKGYEADIDSYIDSDEYQSAFGENIVPYYRDLVATGKGGQRAVGFSRLFQLYRGYAGSSNSQLGGNDVRLATELGRNTVSTINAPGGAGVGYRPSLKGTVVNSAFGGSGTWASGQLFRVEVAGIKNPGYPLVRRSNKAVIIPFEELFDHMQRVHRQGGKISSVTPI
jgi:phycocyanin-associated rod linker protein